MGIAASHGRFLNLTARKGDLEFSGQVNNQQRMRLAFEAEELFEDISLVDPDTDEYEAIMTQIEALRTQDRALELELRNLDTQQQAVQTEIDAVQKVIDKNIDLTFKTFA